MPDAAFTVAGQTYYITANEGDARPNAADDYRKTRSVRLTGVLIMARPKAKASSLRYHLSGQSVVTIDGKDYYLFATRPLSAKATLKVKNSTQAIRP